MQHNWKLTAAILAVLAVPFALAVRQDAREDRPPGEALAELARGELEAAVALEAADEPEPAAPGSRGDQEPAVDPRLSELSGDIAADVDGGELCSEAARPVGDYRRAAETLTAAWGPGMATAAFDQLWLAPKTRQRVILGGDGWAATLRCEPYLPLAAALGERDGRFGFARIELVGATVEQIAAAYGDAVAHQDDASMLVYLPPIDLAAAPTPLRLDLRAGRVTGYTLVLEERRADLVLQQIERVAGPARRDGQRFVFGDSGALSLEVDSGAGVLTLRGR